MYFSDIEATDGLLPSSPWWWWWCNKLHWRVGILLSCRLVLFCLWKSMLSNSGPLLELQICIWFTNCICRLQMLAHTNSHYCYRYQRGTKAVETKCGRPTLQLKLHSSDEPDWNCISYHHNGITSSLAIAEKSICMVSQFWTKDDSLFSYSAYNTGLFIFNHCDVIQPAKLSYSVK